MMIMIRMTTIAPPPLTITPITDRQCTHVLYALLFTLNNNPVRQLHYPYFTDRKLRIRIVNISKSHSY